MARHYSQKQQEYADCQDAADKAQIRKSWHRSLKNSVAVAGQYGCLYQMYIAAWALFKGRHL